MINLLFLLMFKANAIEISYPGDTIVVTCDDGKSYKLRINNNFKEEVLQKIEDNWFEMIINEKCKGVLK